MKNGAANAVANDSPPRISLVVGTTTRLPLPASAAEMPAKPPKNGATQVKLMTVNASAPKIVPTTPPWDCLAWRRLTMKLGNVNSYMPNRESASTTNSTPSNTFVTGWTDNQAMNFRSANAEKPSTTMMVVQ